MQSLVARQAVLRPTALKLSSRTFATSSARAQAVPTEKPVLTKEFKIYRWVRGRSWSPERSGALICDLKNPDEPAAKPKLQTYSIDLNQCGPMVSKMSCSSPGLFPSLRVL